MIIGTIKEKTKIKIGKLEIESNPVEVLMSLIAGIHSLPISLSFDGICPSSNCKYEALMQMEKTFVCKCSFIL